MKELLLTITKELVENPEEISITTDEPNENGVTVFHLHVAQSDMGRVIGREGRIIKSIRTIMRSAAVKNNCKVSIEVE